MKTSGNVIEKSGSKHVYKRPQDFRVLFVYPNIQMSSLAPLSIAILSGVLKDRGFIVDLFDATFYITPHSTDTNQEKVYLSKVRPFDWSERGIASKDSDIVRDFIKKVVDFNPDLLAISTVESSWPIVDILLSARPRSIPTIVGGVFATYASEILIADPRIDYVCRGEGEMPLLALCNALCEGRPADNVPNIWAKTNGSIIRNALGPVMKLDDLPFPDWTIFESQSMYRPMQGHVWRTIGLETQRGCPFHCTYCNSPANTALYRDEKAGNFYRKKSVKRIAAEIEHGRRLVDAELIYFSTDTFLAMSKRQFDEFAEMYQSYRIPFWMNTRAETVNNHFVEGLERMNCLRMNVGIEHGNEHFRAEVLGRHLTNKTILDAFNLCSGRSFVCVSNSIIGFPEETRELVFDTIELNRNLPSDIEATGAFIFTPFHGTALRKRAVQKGYLRPETICSHTVTSKSVLDMPHFSPEAIRGLCRVFSFYTKMPKDRWADIVCAEKFDEEGESYFQSLFEEYHRSYVMPNRLPKMAMINNEIS